MGWNYNFVFFGWGGGGVGGGWGWISDWGGDLVMSLTDGGGCPHNGKPRPGFANHVYRTK